MHLPLSVRQLGTHTSGAELSGHLACAAYRRPVDRPKFKCKSWIEVGEINLSLGGKTLEFRAWYAESSDVGMGAVL